MNNAAVHRLSSHELNQAREDLDALFKSDETIVTQAREVTDFEAIADSISPDLADLLGRAQKTLTTLDEDQTEELKTLIEQLQTAIVNDYDIAIPNLQEELEDFLYYISTNSDS